MMGTSGNSSAGSAAVICRAKAFGRALVEDFEEQVHLKGGLTITLGSDDEDNMTSLSEVDLYENLWEKIAGYTQLEESPF